MIRVSRLNGKEFVVNCEMIKFLEATPDTVLTLVTGEKLLVKESIDAIIAATKCYRQELYQAPLGEKQHSD